MGLSQQKMNDVVSGPNSYQLKKDFNSDRIVLTLSGIDIGGANAGIRALAKLSSDPRLELFGRGFAEYVKVEEMIDWVALELEPYLDLWLQARAQNVSEQISDTISGDLRERLGWLETKLTGESFLVGGQMTLADVCVISALFEPLELAQEMVPSDSRLFAYVKRMAKNPLVKTAFGVFGSGPSLSPKLKESATLHGKVNDLRPLLEGDISNLMQQLKYFTLYIVQYRYTEYNVIETVSQKKMQKFKSMLDSAGGVCGSLSVNGDAPFAITGALIFEGSDLPSHLSGNKDVSQFYKYEKVTDPSAKEKWQTYFNGGSIEGKEVKTRIYF